MAEIYDVQSGWKSTLQILLQISVLYSDMHVPPFGWSRRGCHYQETIVDAAACSIKRNQMQEPKTFE